MQSYRNTELFSTLLSALQSRTLEPSPSLLARFRENRIAQAEKAIRSRNILLYTEGARASTDLQSINTIYTQPVGVPLIVMGYSDNLRYGNVDSGIAEDWPQAHRVRIVGGSNERMLCEDFYFSQSGVSGESRYTDPRFTVPVLLQSHEQFAIDLEYDPNAAGTNETPSQAFVFHCIEVKSQLSADDLKALDDVKRYVKTHGYQRGIFLNAASASAAKATQNSGGPGLSFATAGVGGVAIGTTRPANGPILITGVGTTLGASTLLITDTFDGYSFSLNRPMQSSGLNMPAQDSATFNTAPVFAPVWKSYYQFPIPHLLRPGAQLTVEAINGNDGDVDNQTGNFLIFQGVTV